MLDSFELNAKTIKIGIAGLVGLIAVIVIAVQLFGGSGGEDVNEEALQELRQAEEGTIGNARLAPGASMDDDGME